MRAASHSSSRSVVRAAWQKALKSDHVDFAMRWGDTGADSITSLHLLLELERATGRSLTFDSLRPHMTVNDIAALLDESEPAMPKPLTDLPTVHLFPGLYGDDPRLAAFRQALQSSVRFSLHELPGLRHAAKSLRSLQRTGEIAAAEVSRSQPQGPLFLTGFSFGGGVAYEAARALNDAGRDVAFLCLLDTVLGEVLAKAASRTTPAIHLKRRLQLALISFDVARTSFLTLLNRTSPLVAHRFRRYMFGLFREYALMRWNPDPLDVDTLLAASEEYGAGTEPIWRRLCSELQVVHLPNGHVQMFEHPAIELLAPTFEKAIQSAAVNRHPHTKASAA